MGSALDSASLIMYPSGYSDGVLGSAKPTDGSGDFTFTRGSNLSATRVGPNGYIEKGYENLLLQSNSFDTTWVKSATSVTGGQADKDGGTDAWLLEAVATTAARVEQPVVSNICTLTIYAKSGTTNWMFLNAGTGGSVYFDIENGVVGNTSSQNIDASITSIGNGWYKITSVVPSITFFRVYPATSNGSLATAGDNIYIQDAMLNQGLVAYPYIETTTAPVAGGILEDEPRIDFSDGCGHLLLEPSRTNLIPYSEYANAVAGSLATITDNVTTSPEGVQNAARFLPTSAFGRWESDSFGSGITNGTTYVASMYFNTNSTLDIVTFYIGWNAAAGADRIGITFNPSTRAYISTFTLGSATLTDYDIGEADNNGWYRVSLIAPATNANASTCLVLRDLNSQANGSDFVDFYGWQMEQDATYPTSYIPTYGVSQTRLGDLCIGAGNVNTLNSVEGVLFLEASALFDDLTRRHIAISDGTAGNRVVLRYDSFTNSIQSFIQIGGVLPVNLNSANYTITDNLKMAFKYKSGDYKLYVNGQIVDSSTDISAFSPNTLDRFELANGNGSLPFYGKAKQVLYFPTALSDDECIALTTI